jgi:cell division protease FtsH
MVCEWGMSEKLGPLAYEKREGPVFLGMSQGHASKDYSESKAQEIDAEVSRIIDEGYKKAFAILNDKKEALEKLTQALLLYETIDGAEVQMLVNGMEASEIEKVRLNKKPGSGGVVTPASVGPAKVTGSDPVGNSGPVTA